MTHKADLIHKMAEFFTSEEFFEKGEDARLELSPDDVRCMNEIIKACDNAISRQAVLNIIDSYSNSQSNADDVTQDCISDVLALPSVTPQEPQRKTGHWEWVQYDYNPKLGDWRCSECRCVVVECVGKEEKDGIPLYRYCPNCGCKLSEISTGSESEGMV